jgi:hypothetical protein
MTRKWRSDDDPIYLRIAKCKASAHDAEREYDLFEALMRTTPTTQAGVLELLEFLASPRPPDIVAHNDLETSIDYITFQWSFMGRADDPAASPAAWLRMLAATLRRFFEEAEVGKNDVSDLVLNLVDLNDSEGDAAQKRAVLLGQLRDALGHPHA